MVAAYSCGVKEFWIYTGLRAAVFVASFAVVAGIWALVTGAEGVPVFWTLLLALVLSGIVSFVVLDRPRRALATRVEQRASRATRKFEELRSREDED